MRFVVTVMVRDEVDIIAAMVEHHVAQGADLIIATDNGSVDGTTEILQRYADLGVLELHHDPVFRKQQDAVVTGWHGGPTRSTAPTGSSMPMPTSSGSRSTEPDAAIGARGDPDVARRVHGPGHEPRRAAGDAGIRRRPLLWRDRRTPEQLQAVGIFAQPTDDAVHRGDPDVKVAQGNHFVSLKSTGQPDPALALEVLHLPWRSWLQYERRVVNTGRSYEANPPSVRARTTTAWPTIGGISPGGCSTRSWSACRWRGTWPAATRTVPSSATRGCAIICTRSSTTR